MKQQLTIEEMQAIIKQFCDERDWQQFHTPKDLAIGMSTESNELLDMFRFKSDLDSLNVLKNSKKEISDELIDVLYYILRFSELYDIDITESFLQKMNQNALKYPAELVRGKNKKYNEY